MKHIYTFLCLFLLALPITSWGAELTLDCKYAYTIHLCKACSGKNYYDVQNITLRINFDNRTLTQDNVRGVPFTIEGDTVLYELMSGADRKYPMYYRYSLNGINGQLKFANWVRISNAEDYWNVDQDGYTTTDHEFFECAKVDKLF